MKTRRHLYYIVSLLLPLLALIYCFFIFHAGQSGDNQLGLHYLTGIPNYYFFYTVILPFISAGVIYLALENKNIRFFGQLDHALSERQKDKVLIYRKILPVVAVLVSVLVVCQDAIKKDYTLPPYSFSVETEQGYQEVVALFACLRKWTTCKPDISIENGTSKYLEALRKNGFTGQNVTGFDSFSSWYSQSSKLYKYESFLSFLAALVISIFFAEVFLLLVVKNNTKPATKNLVIWLLILPTFWFPTKLYSAWHYTLGEFSTPAIFWFGILLLALCVLLVFFIKTERNDLYKYGSIIAVLFSAGMTVLSWRYPELFEKGAQLIQYIGLMYGLIFLVLLAFTLYLVTDHFIDNYEQEIAK